MERRSEEGREKKAGERDGKGGLRMKELTAATGLAKSAILHYIAQGLLPEPVRTGRNMAYYDPGCVERIKFIKSLQSSYSFPLGKIKLLLSMRDQGKDITPMIELNEVIFGAREEPSLTGEDFYAAAGLSEAQTGDLIRKGLLVPLEDGRFNQYDVNVGKLYAEGFNRGLSADDLTFYAESAGKIVDGEMALRRKLTGHMPEEEDVRTTMGLVRAARTIRNYVLDRSFQARVTSFKDLKGEGAS